MTEKQESPLRHVSMIALGVKDMARSTAFYRDVLGLSQQGPEGELTFFQAGGVILALNHPLGEAAGDAIVGAVEVIFPVPAVTAAHGLLVERGCVFERSPREIMAGTWAATWAATFTDPDGHRLTILGPQ